MKQSRLDEIVALETKKVSGAKSNFDKAQQAMRSLDLTSLNDDDTPQSISRLCEKALSLPNNFPASVCVYPKFVAHASNELMGSFVRIATVINFPFGNKTNAGEIATPENTKQAIYEAIADGANEIDMVIDFEGFKSMERDAEKNMIDILGACRHACGDDVVMKVILETASFEFESEMFDLSCIVMENGADFIKTSTGKHADGGASMNTVIAMCMAIKQFKSERNVGLKISGGVNGDNYSRYIGLVENMMGKDFINPASFRFGASSVYDDLYLSIKNEGDINPVIKSKKLGNSPVAY